MKIRGLFAALSLAVVLGACTSDVTLPAPEDTSPESLVDQPLSGPQYEDSSYTGGGMGSGN